MPSQNSIYLPVKHIRQDKRMSCWYASAQMVLAYRGKVMSVASMSTNMRTTERYMKNVGLWCYEVSKFSHEVGLSWRRRWDVIKTRSPAGWVTALQLYGPLWVATWKTMGGQEYGHIVVVFGVTTDGNLKVNDPENMVATETPVATFESIMLNGVPVLFKLSGGTI